MNVDGLTCAYVDPATLDATAGKHECVDFADIDHCQSQIAVERGC
jgi:hypothetical protein